MSNRLLALGSRQPRIVVIGVLAIAAWVVVGLLVLDFAYFIYALGRFGIALYRATGG